MYRFYTGLALWFCVVLTNHLDWFFVNRPYFEIFSKTYYFVEPYTFSDILWTGIQKFNVVIMSIATYLIVLGLLSRFPKNTVKEIKKIKIFALLTFVIVASTYIYQTISATIMYIQAFRGEMTLVISIVMAITMLLVLALIYFSFTTFKRGIIVDKNIELNNKIDSFSDKVHDLVENYRDIEAVASEMKPSDLIQPWKKVIHNKTRLLYIQADEFLKKLEAEKKPENEPRKRKKISS